MHHRTDIIKIGAFVAKILQFFIIQHGGHLPSWICFRHTWTTTESTWWSLLVCKIWLC